MKKTNKAGFTLIELLVVIGIIAALAGFAITNLGSADKALQLASMKQDVKSTITQIQIGAVNGDGLTTTKVDVAAKPLAQSANIGTNIDTQLSPNNALSAQAVTCTAGQPGYYIVVTSTKYDTGKEVGYNSCQDVAPKTDVKDSTKDRL